MNEQEIKKLTSHLQNLVKAFAAQVNAEPFDIGEISIDLTEIDDCVQQLEELINNE